MAAWAKAVAIQMSFLGDKMIVRVEAVEEPDKSQQD